MAFSHGTRLIYLCLQALLFYEYLITIRRELDAIWARKQTGASLIFLANRYIALTIAITAFIPIRSHQVRRPISAWSRYLPNTIQHPWVLPSEEVMYITTAEISRLINSDDSCLAINWLGSILPLVQYTLFACRLSVLYLD